MASALAVLQLPMRATLAYTSLALEVMLAETPRLITGAAGGLPTARKSVPLFIYFLRTIFCTTGERIQIE